MSELTNIKHTSEDYDNLLTKISDTYLEGKQKAVSLVNTELLNTYWKVGEHIVEFEQKGRERAEYGSHLLEMLSKDLSILHGKGFSLSNVKRMRQFYKEYPKSATVSHQLIRKDISNLFTLIAEEEIEEAEKALKDLQKLIEEDDIELKRAEIQIEYLKEEE